MSYFQNQILISMPHLNDPIFGRSIVYICSHNHEGAMGLIINKDIHYEGLKKLYREIKIQDDFIEKTFHPIYYGGPVTLERAFLLHSSDVLVGGSLEICKNIALSSDIKILDLIKDKIGPQHVKLFLGYAGWTEGQLEGEIENGDWLFQDADTDFIFTDDYEGKWSELLKNFHVISS